MVMDWANLWVKDLAWPDIIKPKFEIMGSKMKRFVINVLKWIGLVEVDDHQFFHSLYLRVCI